MATYDQIGQQFVQQYYSVFDSMNKDLLLSLYHPDAYVTFEGTNGVGHPGIKEVFESKIRFGKIQHKLTKVDCHPTPENGILVLVIGQLKTDDDPPQPFSQMFYVRPSNNSYFITNDMFRLCLHDG